MLAYAKALVGALLAFLTALATALATGGVSAQEWITAAIAALVTLGGVYGTPNVSTVPAPSTPAPSTGDEIRAFFSPTTPTAAPVPAPVADTPVAPAPVVSPDKF
jgi:hypothetical protein